MVDASANAAMKRCRRRRESITFATTKKIARYFMPSVNVSKLDDGQYDQSAENASRVNRPKRARPGQPARVSLRWYNSQEPASAKRAPPAAILAKPISSSPSSQFP